MSDGAISQDEIDALLSGTDLGGMDFGDSSSSPVNLDTSYISELVSTLKEQLATNMKTMTGGDVSVDDPVVEVIDRESMLKKIPDMVVAIMADFSSGLVGDHLFVMPHEFVQKFVGLVNKEDAPDIDEMALSVVSELFSTYSGLQITELEKTGKLSNLVANPASPVDSPKAAVRFPQGSFVLISYPVSIDGSPYNIWEAIAMEPAKSITTALGGEDPSAAQPVAPQQEMQQPVQQQMQQPVQQQMQQPMQQQMQQPMQQQMQGGAFTGANAASVQQIQYPSLTQGVGSMEQGNIGLIMDVYMEMTVELGRTKKQIKEILGMGEGTIIELDKLAGEPVDILVNHKPIAKGEVVVIDENFGVRVTEILSPMERVSDLR
ncbi:MAG TPA: flagellar motor switch protein FliN [Treponemataceae bacterium]|nr:flagellar motor switch protein FliN [Treponemataceae bacterium]